MTQISTQSYHCWPFFEYSEVVFRSFGNFDKDISGIIFLRKLALCKLKEQELCPDLFDDLHSTWTQAWKLTNLSLLVNLLEFTNVLFQTSHLIFISFHFILCKEQNIGTILVKLVNHLVFLIIYLNNIICWHQSILNTNSIFLYLDDLCYHLTLKVNL